MTDEVFETAYHAPIHHRAITDTPTEHALPIAFAVAPTAPQRVELEETTPVSSATGGPAPSPWPQHHQLPTHTEPVQHRPVHVAGIPQARQFENPQPMANSGRHLAVDSPYAPPKQLAKAPKPVKHTHWGAVITAAIVSGMLASIATHAWVTFHPAARPGQAAPGIVQTTAPGYPTGPTAPPGGVENSTSTNPYWQGVTATVADSVVAIQARTTGGGSVGSGFILDEAGHVLTNNHVIAGAENNQVQVTLADGRLHHATIVGGDTFTDLAVILIQNPPADLRAVALGDSDALYVGDPVLAIGNPLGLANTSTTGIISALNRPVTATGQDGIPETITNAIQIDAAINPGNSGGPLFDHQGRVIGVTSSIASLSTGMFGGSSGSIGLGFAIPINLARNISAQLIEHGEAQHPRLGVTIESDTATVDGISRRGARVTIVAPGTAAVDAGLQVGDVVIGMNGLPVTGSDSLTGLVRERSVGDVIELVVIRDGQLLTLTATLGAMTDVVAAPVPEPELTLPPENGEGPEVEDESWLDEYGYQYGQPYDTEQGYVPQPNSAD